MIKDALKFIIELLNEFILPPNSTNQEKDVELANIALIDAYNDSSVQNVSDKVIASVVNIEQEPLLRNLPQIKTVVGEDGVPRGIRQSPEVYLNVYVLFGANNKTYANALYYTSKVIGFFQKNHVFTSEQYPVLAPSIQTLIFDLYSTTFEELNHLWSINGGKYIPSVMYKMRMAIIQEAEPLEAPLIDELGAIPNPMS